jgi:hypothetical protein
MPRAQSDLDGQTPVLYLISFEVLLLTLKRAIKLKKFILKK